MASLQNEAQNIVQCVHCQNNVVYYCNTCGEAICVTCKDRHIKRQKSHQIVLFKDRQNPKIVSEKCRIHQKLVYVMVCENCSVPVCTKCITDDHRGHVFEDLYEDFITKHDKCKQVVDRLRREILPQSHALLSNVKRDLSICESTFDDVRSNMVSSANQLKDQIDTILEENIAEVEKKERNTESSLTEQEQIMIKHIKYLEETVSNYERIEKIDNLSEIIRFHTQNSIDKIPAFPELYQVVFPSFVKKEVEYSALKSKFGIIKEMDVKPILRTTEEIKIEDEKCFIKETNVKCTKQEKGEKVKKSAEGAKSPPKTYKPSILEIISTNEIEGVVCTRHMTCQGDNMWISDGSGSLVLSDIKGNIIDRIRDKTYAGDGMHTVAQSGELLIINEGKNCVSKRSMDKKMKTVIKTGDWSPKSVFCSPLNGKISVALMKCESNREPKAGSGMVVVYNCSFEKIREIKYYEDGSDLYGLPYYITENINGDICVSDFAKKSIIVVDELGRHQFSYSGHPVDPEFHPSGICCDSKGNILAFNSSCRTVHLIDQRGIFLSRILDMADNMHLGNSSPEPCGICCDNEGNLWVGENLSPVVRIFKYYNTEGLLHYYYVDHMIEDFLKN